MFTKLLVAGFCTTMLLSAAESNSSVNGAQMGDARLSIAAMQGDKDAVRSLLKERVDVNAPQGDGTTALHWAAYGDDPEMAKLLIEAGANVKASTRLGGLTPLLMAATNGSAAMIDLLLKAGADVNSTDAHETTPLMLAAASGSSDAVKTLLDHGAEVNAREATWGQTALMFASALNRAAVIDLLIAHHADANVTSKAVSLAPYTPYNANEKDQEVDPYANTPRAMGGMTALHYAAREGQGDAVRSLVEGGANINQSSAADNTSVLTEAIINGHYDIAKFLLDHGADPKVINTDGLGPLYALIDMQWANRTWYPPANVDEEKVNYLDLVKELLVHGANPNDRITKQLWFRRFQGVGASDWVDPKGATPLWRAAQANDLPAMKLLVASGADPKIPTDRGTTLLMVAAGYGFEDQLTAVAPDARMEVVKYVVNELGENVKATDKNGYTALHGAAYLGNNELINFLVSKGADVKARAHGFLQSEGQKVSEAPNGKGDTVADMANGPREHGIQHPDTLALLVKLGSVNSNNCRSSTCVPVVNSPGFDDDLQQKSEESPSSQK